jgi:hypothetical protein
VVKTILSLWEILVCRNGGIKISLLSTIVLFTRRSASSAVLWFNSSFVGPSKVAMISLSALGYFAWMSFVQCWGFLGTSCCIFPGAIFRPSQRSLALAVNQGLLFSSVNVVPGLLGRLVILFTQPRAIENTKLTHTIAAVTDPVILIHNDHCHNRTISKKAIISLYISESPIEIMITYNYNVVVKTYPYFVTGAAKPVTQVGILL